MKEAENKALK